MEETCEILLTEGYHSISGQDVRLAIHPDADPGSSKSGVNKNSLF